MKSIICVTEKEYYKAEEIFKASQDFECVAVDLAEKVLAGAVQKNNAFGVIIGVEDYVGQLYTVLPRGGVIARFGVGHDGVDKEKATENGLIATNTPGVLDDSVAEHAILLMGTIARNISRHDQDMKNKQWDPGIGSELKGKTLLVLGCGPIGCKTAKIASFGFGMNVIGHDIAKLDEKKLQSEFGFAKLVSSLDEVVSCADFISIHLPSVAATKHIINAEFLSKLKLGCSVINTARGPIVDEVALYDHLKGNKNAYAALDVFEAEPFEPVDSGKDIRTLSNIILTPHVGSSTVEACRRMAQSCLENIKAGYDKEYSKLDILNPQVLEKIK